MSIAIYLQPAYTYFHEDVPAITVSRSSFIVGLYTNRKKCSSKIKLPCTCTVLPNYDKGT